MGKSGIPESVLKKLRVYEEINIDSSSNGYITKEILASYIRKNYNDVKLVIFDKCTVHTSELLQTIYKNKEIRQVSIPSNCTKYVQPLDVSVFRSFKAKLDHFKSKYIEENFENRTKVGNIVNPGRQCAINWVRAALIQVEREIIVDLFKYCKFITERIMH